MKSLFKFEKHYIVLHFSAKKAETKQKFLLSLYLIGNRYCKIV